MVLKLRRQNPVLHLIPFQTHLGQRLVLVHFFEALVFPCRLVCHLPRQDQLVFKLFVHYYFLLMPNRRFGMNSIEVQNK